MKKHYKFIVGIVIGLILSGIVGYAATVISSANVSYNNSNSGLKSSTLQGAIDEVNTKATTKLEEAKNSCPDGYECNPIRYFSYISGDFTADDIRTQNITNYKSVGKTVFAFADARGNSSGVCVDNGEYGGLFCIKINDYENSKTAMKEYFGEEHCNYYSNSDIFICTSSFYACHAESTGKVLCGADDTGGFCDVSADGSFNCTVV